MLREIAYTVVGLVLFAFALERGLALFDDPREPKRVHPKIPFIGHVLGLISNGAAGYYRKTGNSTDAEIFTLSIVNTKIYVTNSPRLRPLIPKAHKTLSFRPFIQTAAKVMGDASDETFDKLGSDLVDDVSHAMRMSLGPGIYLDEKNIRMGKRAVKEIDDLFQAGRPDGSAKTKVLLLDWVRNIVVQATSCGVFGEEHPFCDPVVTRAFWVWQSYLPLHFAKLDITGKGYAAREIVYDAFRKYCRNLPSDASQLTKERDRIMRESNFPEDENYKQQATFGTAAFGNSSPTLYWTIYELFSRPELLKAVREEVVENAVSGIKDSGYRLDVTALKTRCPLLLSVLQETQRTRSIHSNIRKVVEDTLLDGKYFLRAGNYLQMPGAPIHYDPNLWGDSINEFDPYRFMYKQDKSRKPVAPSSFTPWGTPPHLCPARQFATTEILIIVALLAMRCDMKPTGRPDWERNPTLEKGDVVSLYNPKKDIEVEVEERRDWVGDWSVEIGESSTRIALASG